MASPSSSWFRQFQVLATTNRRLLTRRPVHLCILLFSSTICMIFAWLAGRDARGPNGTFPPLTECGMVDPYYVANIRYSSFELGRSYSSSSSSSEGEIPISLNEPWRRGLPVELYITFCPIEIYIFSCTSTTSSLTRKRHYSSDEMM